MTLPASAGKEVSTPIVGIIIKHSSSTLEVVPFLYGKHSQATAMEAKPVVKK